MKRREEELFYAVQVLQKQSTLLRQENGRLMEALQDSAQAVGSKVATEQGDVAAILRRARMKRLDVGKPALASEAPAIAAMLQTVPFLQAVHPDHLKDLAATARLVECRAGEAVCGPESEVIGVPLVASGRLATHAGDREYEAGHHVLDLAALANLQWGEEVRGEGGGPGPGGDGARGVHRGRRGTDRLTATRPPALPVSLARLRSTARNPPRSTGSASSSSSSGSRATPASSPASTSPWPSTWTRRAAAAAATGRRAAPAGPRPPLRRWRSSPCPRRRRPSPRSWRAC